MSETDETTELEDEIDAKQARAMVASGKARAIDIRGPEIAGDGHVPGATVVVEDDLAAAAESALQRAELPLLVFGDDDGQAREAAGKLRDEGHSAASVSGGVGAWTGAGGQLQPGTDEEYEGPELKQPGG